MEAEGRATWPREGVGMDEGLGGALRAQGTGGERGGVREREREESAQEGGRSPEKSQKTEETLSVATNRPLRGPERGHRQATERRKTPNAGGLGRGCAPGT